MIYTARYAHLEAKPKHKKGSIIKPEQKIGRMGTSGQSTAIHLHFDLIQSKNPGRVYRLKELHNFISDLPALMQQHAYFLDIGIFRTFLFIPTYFGDPDYYNAYDEYKFHPGYDLVPHDRHDTTEHFDISWNRTFPGLVTDIGYDKLGYGHYITIQYEA